jgi:hypothetical protein
MKELIIKDKIYTIRDKQVMLDRDLAKLYGVKSRRLREQVKRNPKRFPPDFMFKLNYQEVNYMVSQNAIPSKKHLGGYLPYVFTEQGVANLSSVLNNDRAIQVNIQIMRAFVAMRKFITTNAKIFDRLERVETKQIEYNKNFKKIFNALQTQKPKQGIFFDGQIFDAHKFVSDLIKQAKKEIILIDNYVDYNTLLLFSDLKDIYVKIYTKNITDKLKLDLKKFKKQFFEIKINKFNKSHDRFLIIDDKICHFGASLKDLGKKWFAFSKLDLDSIEILKKIER